MTRDWGATAQRLTTVCVCVCVRACVCVCVTGPLLQKLSHEALLALALAKYWPTPTDPALQTQVCDMHTHTHVRTHTHTHTHTHVRAHARTHSVNTRALLRVRPITVPNCTVTSGGIENFVCVVCVSPYYVGAQRSQCRYVRQQ